MQLIRTGAAFDTYSWQREIKRRASQSGAGIEFKPGIPTAYTDGHTVYVPSPPQNPSYEDYQVIRGMVIHEVGHLIRKKVFRIMKDHGITVKHPLGVLFNIIEDRAQERANCLKFPGDVKAIDELHSILNERVGRTVADKIAKGEFVNDDTATKLQAATIVAIKAALDWMPRTASSFPHLHRLVQKLYGQPLIDLVDALESEGWVERIHEVTDEDHSFRTSKALFERLFPEMEMPQPQSGKGSGKASGKPEKGEEEEEMVGGLVPWELILRSEHGQREEYGAPCPSSIDWSGKPASKKPPVWFDNEKVSTPPVKSGRIKGVDYPRELVNETRRLLQARSRTNWRREQLEGRLDRRNLQRLLMPQVGDGTYNRSVFQKRVPGLKLDTAVTVLVDSSGSMSGEKFQAATEAAVCLYDMCQVALRVPCEVLGFTHGGGWGSGGPQFWLYKEFKERRLPRETIVGRMAYAGERLSGNSDGDALMFAAQRIKNQRSARKVIIVLSDGNPAEAGNGDPDDTLKAAIKEIRAGGEVELFGIGIMDNNVRRYYSKNAPVLNSASEVPKALIDVLKDVLQKEPGA